MSTSVESHSLVGTGTFRAWAFRAGYLIASGLIICSYASIFRPMWTDEAIHFVLSGQPSLGHLLLRLHNPDAAFLTRQTGFYQVLNYLSFQVTGANWVVLRFPSIASAALMIWGMYVFLRERGASRAFQFVGLVALAGQAGFMYYVGEARPYLPYAAAALGMLAYFTSSVETQETSSVRWLGLSSFFLGALFHLYFLLVLPAIVAYGVWYRFFRESRRPSWREVLRASHPGLVTSSVALSLALGWLTWMRPQATSQLEAFAWTGGSIASLTDNVVLFHLEFMPAQALRTSFLLLEVILLSYLILGRRYRRYRELFASGVLVLLAMGTSLIISVSSVLNHYAIANRQLVVGPLFICVAVTWQLFIISQASRAIHLTRSQLAGGVSVGLLYGFLLMEVKSRIPAAPITLFVVANVLAAAVLARTELHRWVPRRNSLIVALTTALGVTTIFLSMPTRMPPGWLALAAVPPLIALIIFSASSGGTTGILTLSLAVNITVMACFALFAAIFTSYRVTAFQSEYSARVKLEEEISNLGSSGVLRLKELDRQTIATAQSGEGVDWVYLANVNALRGGPVWPVLGSL